MFPQCHRCWKCTKGYFLHFHLLRCSCAGVRRKTEALKNWFVLVFFTNWTVLALQFNDINVVQPSHETIRSLHDTITTRYDHYTIRSLHDTIRIDAKGDDMNIYDTIRAVIVKIQTFTIFTFCQVPERK